MRERLIEFWINSRPLNTFDFPEATEPIRRLIGRIGNSFCAWLRKFSNRILVIITENHSPEWKKGAGHSRTLPPILLKRSHPPFYQTNLVIRDLRYQEPALTPVLRQGGHLCLSQ